MTEMLGLGLVEKGEQLVEVDAQKLLPGQRLQQAIDAIEHDHPGPLLFHRAAHPLDEFAQQQLRRVQLFDPQAPGRDVVLQGYPQRRRPHQQRMLPLLKGVDDRARISL
jgi:hypothetical protein